MAQISAVVSGSCTPGDVFESSKSSAILRCFLVYFLVSM